MLKDFNVFIYCCNLASSYRIIEDCYIPMPISYLILSPCPFQDCRCQQVVLAVTQFWNNLFPYDLSSRKMVSFQAMNENGVNKTSFLQPFVFLLVTQHPAFSISLCMYFSVANAVTLSNIMPCGDIHLLEKSCSLFVHLCISTRFLLLSSWNLNVALLN